MNSDGVMKSAILMLALGQEEAAEVMKFLSPKEVQKLGAAMTTLKSVGREQVDAVVDDFLTAADLTADIGMDSDEYIRSVLQKALGDDEASNVLHQILESRDATGIISLRLMDAATVSEFIQNEHPQIIATILVHLEPDHASKIIGYFPNSLRQDVMLRIATLDGVKPVALRELNDVMNKLLTGNDSLKKKSMGGIKVAADIINFMSGDNETVVMEGLKSYDDEMAQKIMDEMFVFDDIIDIEDKAIQVILKEVQSDMLIIALKGTTEQMREKIFNNMSSRAAEMMKEDLEAKGPVKLSEVEAQQRKILQIVRRLADEGEIQLSGRGDGEQYV
ncbi:MAG: flagellar motor switch protein FliG [Sulfuritalea sp.]|jgi:flagellar motor switch protein FliG|nr:flagellar motor switch protein FliG [Sulfuritalea sp.]